MLFSICACTAGQTRKRKHRADSPDMANGKELGCALRSFVVSRPVMEARGHTGYLVFARAAVNAVSAGGEGQPQYLQEPADPEAVIKSADEVF